MKKELIEYIKSDNFTEASLKQIKKFLGASKQHINDELISELKKLELEGFLYEDRDGLYKKCPSNFFVVNLNATKRGNLYTYINDVRYELKQNNLNGALAYDKVIVKLVQKEYKEELKVVKVLVRNMPQLVCEVREENGIKYLYPTNTNNNLKITIGSREMKKRTVGQRILVKVTEEMFEDYYVAEYVKVIGNINDPDIDFKTIAYNAGFNLEFSNAVMNEVKNLPTEITDEDRKKYVDLTDLPVCTIDGKDCKDMDDAVLVKRTEKGGYLLVVPIACLSKYVPIGSELYKEALNRSTSVYAANTVIPMFPYEISNGICSLNENVDRLARTHIIEFDKDLNIIDYRRTTAIIHSRKKMNYEDVEKVINGEEIPEGYEPYVEDLKVFSEWSEKMSAIKRQKGYLRFYSSEIKFELNELGETNSINEKTRLNSEEMIENAMVVVNTLAPDGLYIYRNHEIPDEIKLDEVIDTFKELGYKTSHIKNLEPSFAIQQLLDQFKDKEEFLVLSMILLKTMPRAYYSPDNYGHFGLAEEKYAHRTSPIRRSPDFINQHIEDLMDNKNLSDQDIDKIYEYLKEISKHASHMERQADRVEYEMDKLQIVNYVKSHIGEQIEAFIEGIDQKKIKVRSKELMDGIVSYNDMPEQVTLLPSGKLRGNDSKQYYKVGHKVLLEIKDASYVDKTVSYKIIENLTLKELNEQKLIKKLGK